MSPRGIDKVNPPRQDDRMTNPNTSADTDYAAALAAAAAYTDAVGLSDGTDRPAANIAELDNGFIRARIVIDANGLARPVRLAR